MMHPANGQLKAAVTVPLYPASAAIVESAPAEQQDNEKDDDESGCVHCGLIMSGRCVFWLFCFERRGNAWNRTWKRLESEATANISLTFEMPLLSKGR
jgi:hypothetical protein